MAGAIKHATFTDEQKAILATAFEAAEVEHIFETYPAKQG